MPFWEIIFWIIAALAGAAALYFLLASAAVAIVFALLYGRTDHRYSRRALFSDFPEVAVERRTLRYGKRKRLALYLIGEKSGKGLVIISHGIRDYGEGYFAEARGFLARGYRVLLYDATGSGASSGKSQRGLPQSAIDLDRVISWAEKEEEFQGVPFYLYGHSWGGYAVCAVFTYGAHERVKAVASLSGFNDPCKMLLESGSTSSKHFGRFFYLPMCAVQFLSFGRKMYRTAEQGIRTAENVRFLILHAEFDDTVKIDGAGIYAKKKELESDRVRFYKEEGRTHFNAWFTEEACAKNAVYDKRFRALSGKYGFRLSRKKEEEFYAPIDRAERIALSEPDPAFFERVDGFYQNGGESDVNA